jgi:hypothetical protein
VLAQSHPFGAGSRFLRSLCSAQSRKRVPGFETNTKFKIQIFKTKSTDLKDSKSRFGHLDFCHSILPFDFAQGGESFGITQDRELVERQVEPFRASDFEFRY